LVKSDSQITLHRAAWTDIYTEYSKDYEWFIKVNDLTFVAVDNLKAYLRRLTPNEPHYIGALQNCSWTAS
jgi:hypothetical protein